MKLGSKCPIMYENRLERIYSFLNIDDKMVFLLFCCLFIIISLSAQSFTDAEKQINQKNVFLNSLKSAAVPGWGQLSIGDKSGYLFIATETIIWSTMFYLREESSLRMKQSRQFAYNNANLSTYKLDDDLWYLLSRHNSSADYNANVIREANEQYQGEFQAEARNRYIEENILKDISWDWSTRNNRDKYRIMRKESMEYEDYALAVSGMIIVNHLVSFFHSIKATNQYNTHIPKIYSSFDPELTPFINILVNF